MKTKAAVLRELGADWSVEDIELDPPRAGEVLVKLAASGLCHSDEHLVTGDLPFQLPIIGGHEGVGVVLEVGPGVTSVAPGDHVVFGFIPSCGRCKWCSTGRQSLCDLGMYLGSGRQISDQTARHHAADGQDLGLMCLLGTFAHHTVVHESSCIRIEKDIPLDKACLVGCGVTTGWGSAVYRADVQPGETVVVVGIGGIGASALQGAKLAGAKHVVAVDPVEYKREKAMELGATHTAASMEDALELVRDITWGQMAEKAILTVGVADGEMVAPLMALIGKGGTAVVTSVAPAFQIDAKLSLFDLAMMQKEIKGVIFGSGNPRADIPKLLSLYRAGQLDLDGITTKVYDLDGVNEGYRDMRDGKNIRGVMVYD